MVVFFSAAHLRLLWAFTRFGITESKSPQFRAEFFNFFNHTNFGVPCVQMGADFGQIVSTANEASITQFALKFRY